MFVTAFTEVHQSHRRDAVGTSHTQPALRGCRTRCRRPQYLGSRNIYIHTYTMPDEERRNVESLETSLKINMPFHKSTSSPCTTLFRPMNTRQHAHIHSHIHIYGNRDYILRSSSSHVVNFFTEIKYNYNT